MAPVDSPISFRLEWGLDLFSRLFFSLFLFTFFSFSLQAISITDDQKNISPEVLVLHDKNNEIKLQDLLNDRTLLQKFFPNAKNKLDFDYPLETSNYWHYIKVTNPASKPSEQVLEIADNMISYFQIHIVQDNTLKFLRKTTSKNPPEPGYRNPIISFSVDPHSSVELFIKIENHHLVRRFPYMLWEKEHFNQYKSKTDLIVGAIFGALLALLIYNGFIALSTKDSTYMAYLFYLLSIITYISIYTGLFTRFFPHVSLDTIILMRGFWLLIMPLTATIFAIKFLNLKAHYKLIVKILTYILMLLSLILVLYFSGVGRSTLGLIAVLSSAPAILISLIAAIGVYRKGETQAKYFLIGWSLVLVGFVLSILRAHGSLPYTPLSVWSGTVGSMLEMLVFSLGLAYRMKKAEKEKELAQNQLLQTQEEAKKLLEDKVMERTQQLETALNNKEYLLREIHHRVKNNLAMINSLLYFGRQKVVHDQISTRVLTDLESRIRSISKIHESLYAQENIQNVVISQYLNEILDSLKEFSPPHAEFTLHISPDTLSLGIDDALSVGLVFNELVTNAEKHAYQPPNILKIDTVFSKENGQYRLVVKDNGPGLPPVKSKSENSLGMVLIDTIASKHLDGQLNYENQNGLKVTVTF